MSKILFIALFLSLELLAVGKGTQARTKLEEVVGPGLNDGEEVPRVFPPGGPVIMQDPDKDVKDTGDLEEPIDTNFCEDTAGADFGSAEILPPPPFAFPVEPQCEPVCMRIPMFLRPIYGDLEEHPIFAIPKKKPKPPVVHQTPEFFRRYFEEQKGN